MSQPVTRKFKLRRIKPVQQEVIEENLKPLKENIQKKKRAQEAYYENQNALGVSPLTRDNGRRPVHQRLGRRVPFNGTNTSAIPPKRRMRRIGSDFTNPPFIKRTRIFTAQQRLNRIRANQREVLNSQMSYTPKRIKLRRTLPQQSISPNNLQVQVKNTTFVNSQQQFQNVKRFKQILQPLLQLEIKKIQLDYHGSPLIHPIEITPVATGIAMHRRFAQLS